MDQEIIIIGAGASGLMAAIAAAGRGSRVLVIEQREKAGKKLLATGNGKCNFTNLLQTPECYRSEDISFAPKVLAAFDVQRTIRFFRELGILPKERDGYLYPNSEQAASVLQVLLLECKRLGVRFAYEEKVIGILPPDGTVISGSGVQTGKSGAQRDISRTQNDTSETQKGTSSGTSGAKDCYRVQTEKLTEPGKKCSYDAKKVILATGGCASPKLGSDGSGYSLAIGLGHSLIKPLPALVQLKSPDKFLKTLSGVRTIGKVTAYSDQGKLSEEEGELVFTDYGISGIPILQLSRYVAKALDQKKPVQLIIDFLPSYDRKGVREHLEERLKFADGKNLEEMFVGLFNHKLSYIMIKEAGLDPYQHPTGLKNKEMELLTSQIKEFKLRINDTNSFENAQVCAGGVPTAELDPATMESKLAGNLYLCGELVDVDGTCGGYNLQWAWSSGYLAGTSAADRMGNSSR